MFFLVLLIFSSTFSFFFSLQFLCYKYCTFVVGSSSVKRNPGKTSDKFVICYSFPSSDIDKFERRRNRRIIVYGSVTRYGPRNGLNSRTRVHASISKFAADRRTSEQKNRTFNKSGVTLIRGSSRKHKIHVFSPSKVRGSRQRGSAE